MFFLKLRLFTIISTCTKGRLRRAEAMKISRPKYNVLPLGLCFLERLRALLFKVFEEKDLGFNVKILAGEKNEFSLLKNRLKVGPILYNNKHFYGFLHFMLPH